jgi:cation transport ATPase
MERPVIVRVEFPIRFACGLVAAVSALIIACPRALGLATRMSIMVGVGHGAQSAVRIKNAEALELSAHRLARPLRARPVALTGRSSS